MAILPAQVPPRQLALINRLHRVLASFSTDSRRFLIAANRVASAVCDLPCTIYLVAPAGDRLIPAAAAHPNPRLRRAFRDWIMSTGPVPIRPDMRRLLRRGTSGDLPITPGRVPPSFPAGFHRWVAAAAIRSVTVYPMRGRSGPIAALVIGRPGSAPPIPPATAGILTLFAGRVGLALDNVRMVERLRADRLEVERLLTTARLKTRFIGSLAHELRSPLNAVAGFSELLHDGKVGPVSRRQRRHLGHILSACRHLRTLLDETLDLARIDAGRLELKPERVEPRRLVREVIVALQPIAWSKGVRLSSAVGPTPRAVSVDSFRLKQIAYNLLSNAIKATPGNGRVTLRIGAAAAGRFRLEVADNGPGIRRRDQPKLFREFSRITDASGIRHEGTGLGLSIVKRIATTVGGTVGVRSRPGHGSVFWVNLPENWRATSAPTGAAP